jgi:TctA family transporter
MMEEHLRRALLISDGDYAIFLKQPISATFIACTVAVALHSTRKSFLSGGRDNSPATQADSTKSAA